MARETVRLRSKTLMFELKEARSYSLRDMADRLPCGKSMVHALLTGEKTTCSAKLGERIAEVLGVAPQVLFMPVVSTDVVAASKGVAA